MDGVLLAPVELTENELELVVGGGGCCGSLINVNNVANENNFLNNDLNHDAVAIGVLGSGIAVST